MRPSPHQYRPEQLAKFDAAGEQRFDEITSFDAVDAVDEYLEDMDVFPAEEIHDRIDRLDG